MRYKIINQKIPHDKRKALNEKILYLIDNNLTDKYNIIPEHIYNSYTGDGALHGLNFNDYDNFHSFTEAKKEFENGQFFTPHHISKFLIDCIKPSQHDLIADLTAGMGNFCNWLPNLHNTYCNEIDIKAYKVMKFLYPEINITCDDIRSYEPKVKFDIILGNPPFNLKWTHNKEEYLSQLFYCIKASHLLKPAGILALIVPCSFLADDFADGGMIKEMNNRFNFICQFDLPTNSFENVGVSNFATKIMLFQNKSEHVSEIPYNLSKVELSGTSDQNSDFIYKKYMVPIIEAKEKVKHKLLFEQSNENNEDKLFNDRVRKLLFDIKRNPKISIHYARCAEYVNRYHTQVKPESMKYEEWEKSRLTKGKVLSYLTRILKNQHTQDIDKIELVKTNYGLRLKGYSQKNKIYLSKLETTKEITFTDMIVNNVYPFSDQRYYKLFQRKLREYKKQSIPFSEMEQEESIQTFLNDLVITDYENDEHIRLNDVQKQDTNKLLQKNNAFLQWGQGSGKSISGIAQSLYRLKHNNIHNVFIVSTAIAINNTWDVILNNYRYNYKRINNLSDIRTIEKGQIVLVTLNLLSKYQKFIKEFINQRSQKVMLILDESDNISSPSSKRTKAVLSCFRKVKYKSLLTGTSTRNTIAEIATQFELLYNNSVNMISECENIYKQDKEDKEKLNETPNDYYMKPIPAYNKGYKLFSESHIPQKITVFGVGQYTQDIYNSDVLKKLINKTIITRTFEEVTGRKIYEVIQNTVKFNPAERELYRQVIEEFYTMKHLFKSTGNLRKDRMLEILNQLLLMLKVCSVPHTMKEYRSNEEPTKIKHIMNMVGSWNEKVAIGVRHIKTVYAYKSAIQKRFPDRPVFIITGDKVSLNKRKEIIKQLEKTSNGILISTQQSLSSSMNIGFINKIIIPELHWNDSAMSQFYFRFIRLNSKDDNKQVHFVTYENSIESNLLQMILAKEKLNLFMKNQELDDEELHERYGVDFNLLDMLLTKERDQEGRVSIRWGEQKII